MSLDLFTLLSPAVCHPPLLCRRYCVVGVLPSVVSYAVGRLSPDVFLSAVAGTGGDGSLFSALAAIDGCHQETKLLQEIIGQMEGHMAQLGEATSCTAWDRWQRFHGGAAVAPPCRPLQK